MSKLRERFEAWWSKSVMRHYDNTVGHLQMSASIAWQARDAEVKELVEVLRKIIIDDYLCNCECYWMDAKCERCKLRELTLNILTKYESETNE